MPARLTDVAAHRAASSGRRRRALRAAAPHATVLFGAAALAAAAYASLSADEADEWAAAPSSRRRLYEYPAGVCDSYLNTNYTYLAIAMLSWGIFYMFWALAIVCDDYFVPSLDEIIEELKLSPDVAGATFMAAGSSAPELFTSLMGVFAVQNDVGIGTIVGSAVFNLCCIIGGTALFTPTALTIDWKPITRDSFFYGCSIAAMIYVLKPEAYDGETVQGHDHITLEEGKGIVFWYEAVALVVGYCLYVFAMAQNDTLMAVMGRCSGENVAEQLEDEEGEEEEEEEEDSPISKAVQRPLKLAFEVTIPDCTLEHNKKRYMVTFTMSIVWIGVLSYFLVTWASKLGCLWHIHPSIMGVTILAAGTSVPDAIGSLLVAQEGKGDMAVSNAIGSNVFDILLGLGLPWLLGAAIYQKPIDVDAANIVPLSIILFSTLIAVYGVAVVSRFTLTKMVGGIFFSFYFAFVAYSLLHEFGKIPF